MITSFIASLFVKTRYHSGYLASVFYRLCCFPLCDLGRVPWIFELRDLWPESIKAVWFEDSFFIRLMEKVEMFLYKNADAIISVTNSFREELFKEVLIKEKYMSSSNGVDLQIPQARKRL